MYSLFLLFVQNLFKMGECVCVRFLFRPNEYLFDFIFPILQSQSNGKYSSYIKVVDKSMQYVQCESPSGYKTDAAVVRKQVAYLKKSFLVACSFKKLKVE